MKNLAKFIQDLTCTSTKTNLVSTMTYYGREGKPKPYRYYDTPEGQDINKKLIYVLKPTIAGSLFWTTADILVYSQPKGLKSIINRYIYFTVPFVGMATAFVVTANGLNILREKDDELNWIAGGAAVGTIFGIWRRSLAKGLAVGIPFAFFGFLQKAARLRGYNHFPSEVKRVHGSLRSNRMNWSLLKDPRERKKLKEMGDGEVMCVKKQ